jgi:putative SOS response-associated peptidase YedK
VKAFAARWLWEIIQRIAALLALGPSLNELYEQAGPVRRDWRRLSLLMIRLLLASADPGRRRVGFSNIIAKAEGIEGKPAFREAFKPRRCLVPVDNFYGERRPR